MIRGGARTRHGEAIYMSAKITFAGNESSERKHHASWRAARLAGLAALSSMLAFALSGCFVTDPVQITLDEAQEAVNEAQQAVDDAMQDVQNAADAVNSALGGIANAPEALTDMFASADALFSKMASVVVYDAQTGEQVAVVEDAQAIADVTSQVNLVTLVSSHPDSSTAEYQITFSQNETIKLGQSADELKRVEAITFTTYRDSDIVEIYIPAAPEAMNTFDFKVTQEFADALRSLAG